MAKIKSISVRDFTGATNTGIVGEQVTVTLTLDEVLTLTGGPLNSTTFIPNLTVGTGVAAQAIQPSLVNVTSYNLSAKTLTFNVTLPLGYSGSVLNLAGISLNGITLRGATGTLASGSTTLSARYTVDSVLPTFTTTAAIFTDSTIENTNPRNDALFTATATDNNGAVSYRLTGSDASFFNIDSKGVVRFRVAPDYETQSVYNFKVLAVDRAGNTNSKDAVVNVTNSDEAVSLARGVTGAGTIIVAKGSLANQAKTVVGDFINDGSTAGITYSYSTKNVPATVTMENGTLSGSINKAGRYTFTVQANDGAPATLNGKVVNDVTRTYNLVVLDNPAITGIKVTDEDSNNAGNRNSLVNIKVLLSETTNLLPTNAPITANFVAGRSVMTAAYQSMTNEGSQSVLNFVGTLPAGNSNSIALTALTLGNNILTGSISGNTLSKTVRTSQSTSYILDNTAPVLSGLTTASVAENAAQGTVIYTATARDANRVRYSLGGSNASLFSIDASTGVVSVNRNIDFEPLPSSKSISLNVIATDSAGNSASRPLIVAVANQNEATQLVSGAVSTLSNLTLYQGYNASRVISALASDVVDPERAPLTYRTSGTLVPGLMVNASTGAITGNASVTAGSYDFTLTADDGFNNGADAMRRYQVTVSNLNFAQIDKSLISTTNTAVAITLFGNFASGGSVQLYRNDSTPVAVGTAVSITAASETLVANFSKDDLTLASNTSAGYFLQYQAGSTTTQSVTLNISRDDIAPTATAISVIASGAQNGYLNAGDIVTATVSFSEAIQVTGNPTLNLLIGSSTAAARFASSDRSLALFTYTIQSADDDDNGISIATNSLITSDSMQITDIAGNLAATTSPSVAAISSLKVDNMPPGVPNITYTNNGTLGVIASNAIITVTNTDSSGARWQYQVDNSGNWLNGSGTQFNALFGTHTYQVRQVDDAGNTSASSQSQQINCNILARGFAMKGGYEDFAGKAVTAAGDINGDGYADVIVSSLGRAVNGASDRGVTHVVFGKNSATPIELSDVANGTGGFIINGMQAYEAAGEAVQRAGDFNGDGLDDLIIGAYSYDVGNPAVTNAGRAYLVFGTTSTANIQLSNVANGVDGFVINGLCAYDSLGYRVASLGDLNGDGLADILVGSLKNTSNNTGTNSANQYVVFGTTATSNINLSTIAAGTGGFVINKNGSEYVTDVQAVGDVNGDGLRDFVIGAESATTAGGTYAGKSYVVFGQSECTPIQLSDVGNSTGGFVINGKTQYDNSGSSVASVGDLNGDGLADLVIGARNSSPYNLTSAGASYVIFGKTDRNAVNLADITNTSSLGFVINGECAYRESGLKVSAAGDVNGDGIPDILIGAPGTTIGANGYVGRAYVVFGKTGAGTINLSEVAAGTGGFLITGGLSGDLAGEQLAAAGDVNGDGLADILVGARYTFIPPIQTNSYGNAYVIFGKTDTEQVNLSNVFTGEGASVPSSNVPDNNSSTVTGTTAAEILLGAGGDDTIIGGGGADVLLGGSGNDVIQVNLSNVNALRSGVVVNSSGFNQLARIDGGTGIDTLRLQGTDLDLTGIKQFSAGVSNLISRVNSIEKIDLGTDTGTNRLILKLQDVLDISDFNVFNNSNGWNLGASVGKHQLVVNGTLADTVDLADGSGTTGWTKDTSVMNDGITYDIWNHNTAAAQLLIQQNVQVI